LRDGFKFGSDLLLPPAGSRASSIITYPVNTVYGQGNFGIYWASSPHNSNINYAYVLYYHTT
jgi:hypothetical protein